MNREFHRTWRVSRLTVIAAAVAYWAGGSYADSLGPFAPATVIDEDSGSTWTEPGSAAVEDDAFASITLSDTTLEAGLVASGFGFSLPFGSVVTGVEVTVSRHSATGVTPGGVSGGLLIAPDGTMSPEVDLKGDGAAWDTTDIVATLGGVDSLWGLDLTPEDVSDSAFAVVYRVATTSDVADDDTYLVDSIMAEVFFEAPILLDPCDSFPQAQSDRASFAAVFAGSSSDMDGDGLPDSASLALLDAVACDPAAGASLKEATLNAYNINLLALADESDGALVGEYWDIIALLTAMSASMETAVLDALAAADPPVVLTGDYTAVTCEGAGEDEACEPGATLRFGHVDDPLRAMRATNEPFSATGDLDNDETDNLTEYNNVLAQGGTITDFVIAATSPDLDGTDPIVTPGGGGSGGCFIATAVYGTPLADDIGVLRALRDRVLLQGSLGIAFVDVYYRTSPQVADQVANHGALAGVIRFVLVPLVALTGLALKQPVGLAALTMLAAGTLVVTFRGRHRRKGHAR